MVKDLTFKDDITSCIMAAHSSGVKQGRHGGIREVLGKCLYCLSTTEDFDGEIRQVIKATYYLSEWEELRGELK